MAKRFGLVLVLAVVILAACIWPMHASTAKTVTIVHVNDVHGRLEPHRPSGTQQDVGGFTKVAAFVKEMRRSGKQNMLLLSAGDMIHGTNMVNLFGGLPMIEIMNSMGFDAMALGNHEFNFGQERLRYLQSVAKFPFLGANVVYKGTGTPFTAEYVIKDVGGAKVGIFGLSPVETPIVTHPNNVIGLEFLNPIEVSKKVVDKLKGRVDLIVCLSHLGYSEDKALAAAVQGIDVIVGGHSHTLLKEPEKVGSVIIVQAGEHAANIGVLEVAVQGGAVVSYSGKLIPVTADMPDDPLYGEVGARRAYYAEALKAKLGVKVGATSVVLQGERADVRVKETNLGNLVADAMKAATNADVAVTNGGGIRASIQAGDITIGHIYTALPFDNTLVVIEITGDRLLAALEHSVSRYPEQHGAFLHVSGLSFKFDPSKPAGSRVTEAYVGTEPLKPGKVYAVSTNDFVAAGGDGYTWFKDAKVLFYSGEMLRDVVAAYLGGSPAIGTGAEGRIVVVK